MGILLGISEGERGSPGESEDGPALDVEEATEEFDVGDEVRGGVDREVCVGCACEGAGASATALVEDNDAVEFGIEEASLPRGGSASGAAVKEEGGDALGIAGGFPIEVVAIRGGEGSTVVGFDGGEVIDN